MRVSYNDYKLYLSILESVSKQLNRAIKSEVSLNSEDDIPDHDFDGKRDTLFIVHQFFCSEKGKLIKHSNSKTFQKDQLPGYSFYARMAYRQNVLITFVMSRCCGVQNLRVT